MEPEAASVEGAETASQPARAPYGRGRATATVTAAPTTRASRALITDYGYVVDELKRIGLTFGGLIVLLVIIARVLY